jgi:chorismate mutase
MGEEDISNIRQRLDKYTESIVKGIKERSELLLNSGLCTDNYYSLNLFMMDYLDPAFGKKIIDIYRKVPPKVCSQGDNPDEYNKVREIDAANIELLYLRVYETGREIAESKLETEPSLLYVTDEKTLRNILGDEKREQQVIDDAVGWAKESRLSNEQAIRGLFREIMDLTMDAEIGYFKEMQKKAPKQENSKASAWGNTTPAKINRTGWGFSSR